MIRVDVPFELLPRVAIAIFLSRVFYEPFDGTEYPHPFLGPDFRWSDDSLFAEIDNLSRATTPDLVKAWSPISPTATVPDEIIAMVDQFTEFGTTLEALKAGLEVTPDQVPSRIVEALIGKTVGLRRRRHRRAQPTPLTPREKEILDLSDEGCNQTEIAQQIGTSRSYVSKALKNALKKKESVLSHDFHEPRSRSVHADSSLPSDPRGQELFSYRTDDCDFDECDSEDWDND